jgi:hypothetical protein
MGHGGTACRGDHDKPIVSGGWLLLVGQNVTSSYGNRHRMPGALLYSADKAVLFV